MSFWVVADRNDGAVIDAYPVEGPEGWRYLESQQLAPEFHNGAALRFSPSFPDQRKVYDFVTNILDIQIVSERVRRIILELAPQDAEFLPVTLLDHKGAIASREHFIMNTLRRREVIDLEHSDVMMSSVLDTEIQSVSTLALKKDIAPEGPQLFRPLHLRTRILVDATIREAFVRAGLTGYKLFPADGWDGEDY